MNLRCGRNIFGWIFYPIILDKFQNNTYKYIQSDN
jgi:hypothetical protein